MWPIIEYKTRKEFTATEAVPGLLENELGIVRVRNFYSEEELQEIVQRIKDKGVAWYPKFEYKQGRIGIAATEYAPKLNGKNAYFALAADAARTRDELFPGKLSMVDRLQALFVSDYEIGLAKEPTLSGAQYFSGLVRAMNTKSTLHFDFAPRHLSGWSLDQTETQFGVVVYLQMPEEGGGLTVYRRFWKPEDDESAFNMRRVGYTEFDESFLTNTESVVVVPKPGDMILFNSRNFHKVEDMDPKEMRLTCNSFLALYNNSLHLWN